jgi:TolB-like protein
VRVTTTSSTDVSTTTASEAGAAAPLADLAATSTEPEQSGFSTVWHRIVDHKMMHWTLAYAAAGYTLLHGVEMVSGALGWPHVIARLLTLALFLGVPVVITLAWYHGAKGLQKVSGPELTIIAILLAIAGSFLWQFGGSSEHGAQPESAAVAKPHGDAVPDPTLRPAAAAAVANSLAVLPFVNLSGDPTQEYFSDGLTEEITSVLARIRDLKVMGRTSAFKFKGKSDDLRAIGQALGARYLLEGSVRKSGDRLRITAQLIEASGGSHLWTESYDRNLTDVFAIQEEIAKAIAGALGAPLGLKQGESLVTSRTTNVESYQDFLRARALYSSIALGSTDQAIKILEQVVARTPDFAPAWAMLSRAYVVAPVRSVAGRSGSFDKVRNESESRLRRAEAAAQRAVELDPALPDGYSALALLHSTRGNFLAAVDAADKALSLDANHSYALVSQATTLAMVGQLDRALVVSRSGLQQEPFTPQFMLVAADMAWLTGQTDVAIKLARDVSSNTPDRVVLLIKFLASAGRFAEAADLVREFPPDSFLPGVLTEAERLLRSAPAPLSLSRRVPRLGLLDFIYLNVGAPDHALDYIEDSYDAGALFTPRVHNLWHPAYAAVRQTARFKALVRKIGLVDYWRARGWPKFCQPVGADDYTCN